MRTRLAWLTTALVFGCGGSVATEGADGGVAASATGTTGPAVVGAACTPLFESSATFAGFSAREVSVDQGNTACGDMVCLINHFQGRVSCPYGQGPDTANPCTTPSGAIVTPPNGEVVPAECADRSAKRAVYCSCRCANPLGRTDDGDPYCACPSGSSCTQIISPISSNDHFSGGYCVLDGTAYDPNTACESLCDPARSPCP
jgi:hypothetical protein